MVAFVMVVRDILTDRASQVALAERDHSMQTLKLDGPHEPFCMCVTVRSADKCLHNVDTGGAQEREHRATPFYDAIANQHRARVQNTVKVVGQMPYGLQHEEVRCAQCWPVRPQERPPRCGSVWRRRKACVFGINPSASNAARRLD